MTTPDYTSNPDTLTIPLTQGYHTIVEAVDADLALLKWSSEVRTHTCYAKRTHVEQKVQRTLYLHGIILTRMLGRSLVKGEMVDHIDSDGLNNRRSNLRLATRRQNAQNERVRSDNKSNFKGVCWHKRAQKWRAQITINGENKSLGYYATPEEAYAIYCAAAREQFGEFARVE